MNAWSELPNAKHIDWVIESMVSNPDIWIKATIQAYDQTWEQVYDRAYAQAWEQTRNPARFQAWEQTRNKIWSQFLYQVRGVLIALVAYDDCDQYLSMTIDELKIWAVLSEKPQAVLLLPMKWIQENKN